MHRIATESVVLRVTPYGDTSQIVSLFTLQEGKIQAIMRAKSNQAAVSPLLRIESELMTTNSTLYRTTMYSVLDSYRTLRENYVLLQQACALLQAIDLSQQGQKSAPKLYHLLTFYLKRLPELQQTETGASSFYLKILRHEGLFTLTAFETLSDEEKMVIQFLAHVLEWEGLIPIVLPPELHNVIKREFQKRFE